MRVYFIRNIIPVVFALLAGCGGDNAFTQAGSGTGGSGGTSTTVKISLAVGQSPLSAGGSTSVTAKLTDSAGAPYLTDTNVTFSSTCAAAQIASLTTPIKSSGGTAVSTYVAKGCEGTDTITATATVDSGTVTATTTITVLQASLGSIQFISATPTNIVLKGTGGLNKSETSTVIFKVLNNVGGVAVNKDVTFALDTTVGGVSITPATAKTDANGQVQTVVQAGTIPTSVRVTATIVSTTIATQSDLLTITTGIPTQKNFSLSAATLNSESWTKDGVVVAITARAADRFNNPVPDGTAITFTAEGGVIGGSCITAAGACSVNWTSQDFRPANGRVTIMATAIGEESFIDTNGNGLFDDADYFPGPPISSITQANPGKITTTVPHGLKTGDYVTITGVVGMTDLNSNTYVVRSVPTSTTLTLVDTAGNVVDTTTFGAYTSGGTLAIFDLPDAFRDDNENGAHDSGEFFINPNNTNTFTAADGKFNGLACTHTTLCGSNKFYVRDQVVLVMSDAYANIATYIVPTSATATITGVTKASPGVITTAAAHGLGVGSRVYISGVGGMSQLNGNFYYVASTPTATTFTINTETGTPVDTTLFGTYTGGGSIGTSLSAIDVSTGTGCSCSQNVVVTVGDAAHNQPMPKGTTISIASDNGKIFGDTNVTLGNTNYNGPINFYVTVSTDTTSSTGILTITVTAPDGEKTSSFISVKD